MANTVKLRDCCPPGKPEKIGGRGQPVVQRKKDSTNGDMYTVVIDGFGYEDDLPAERLSLENATPADSQQTAKSRFQTVSENDISGKMKGLTFLLAILIHHSEGAMDIGFEENPATLRSKVTITCTKSPSLVAGVSWLNDRYSTTVISFCLHTTDLCTPSKSTLDDRYVFTSDIANRKFTMTIYNVEYADEGVYTCRDFIEEGKAKLYVQPGCAVNEWWNIISITGAIDFVLKLILNIILLVLWETECIKKHGLVIVGIILYVLDLILIIIGSARGRSTDSCIQWLMIMFLCVAVIFIILIILGVLHKLGYLPGYWRHEVRIPDKAFPDIKFKVLLNKYTLERVEYESGAKICIRGKGSEKYEKSLPDNNQPLQAYVTAYIKISVNIAVKRIEAIIMKATRETVKIPQEENPDIRFEEELNHKVLKRVEQQTRTKLIIYGKGSIRYGRYSPPLVYPEQPLHVSITSDNKDNCTKAVKEMEKIFKDAINNHDTFKIPKEETPYIRFEEKLNHKVLKRVEQQTRTKLIIYGKGSSRYGRYSQPLFYPEQPLHVSITSDNKDNRRKAVKEMEKIVKDAINNHDTVKIPQEENSDIRFEEKLNHKVLKRVEQQTRTKIIIYGKGFSRYGKYGQPLVYPEQPLHVSITSDNKDNCTEAVKEMEKIVKDAINNQKQPLPPIGYTDDGKDQQYQLKEIHSESNRVVPLQKVPSQIKATTDK